MRSRFFLVAVLLGLCCLGMGKKKVPFSIRCYTQADKQDTDSFSIPVTLLNGQQVYLDQVSSVSERDIAAIYPFQAADGTMGCGLKLDAHGTIALDTLSVAKRGTLLVETINGRQIADVLIDARITDGVLTIPSGIQPLEMNELKKKFPVIGGKQRTKSKYDAGF